MPKKKTESKKQSKQFQRRIEDFVCETCDMAVAGDGYTNHCPHCLESKHVDVHPGDRAADCGGIMKVSEIVMEHGDVVLTHTCVDCGHSKRNRAHRDDSIEKICELMANMHS